MLQIVEFGLPRLLVTPSSAIYYYMCCFHCARSSSVRLGSSSHNALYSVAHMLHYSSIAMLDGECRVGALESSSCSLYSVNSRLSAAQFTEDLRSFYGKYTESHERSEFMERGSLFKAF